MNIQSKFRFLREALDGSGGFADKTSASYIVQYPRESDVKYMRRVELAEYQNDLRPACTRFAGFLGTRPVMREYPSAVWKRMAENIDGQGNSADVFWGEFALEAKAFGSMLLLVDGAKSPLSVSTGDNVARSNAPTFQGISPDRITDYLIGNDGEFDIVSFSGAYDGAGGQIDSVVWTFDRVGWEVRDLKNKLIDQNKHGLGECPVLIFTESGPFPCFGPFSQIAGLSRRLFNLDSELDEILRSQTFSLLTYQIPQEKASFFSDTDLIATLSASNMLKYYGERPGFIAPPSGPAEVYLKKVEEIRSRIDTVSLKVDIPNAQESGIALQYRFQTLNAALSHFAIRMADLEARAWEMAGKWLKITQAIPTASWPTRFLLSDTISELSILQQMQAAAMPQAVISAQKKKVISVQFVGADSEDMDDLERSVDEPVKEVPSDNNGNTEE